MVHPVVNLAFWRTKDSEVEVMSRIYDAIVGDDPAKKMQLDELLSWAREEAVTEELYNQSDA